MKKVDRYKDWEDLNHDERAEVLEAHQNTEDRNKSGMVEPFIRHFYPSEREKDVKDYYEDNAEKFGFVDRKYKVELTGHTRYFTVTDEKGNVFLATEFYDENTQSSDWGIYKPSKAYNPYAEEHKIDEQQREEIIKAVLKSRKD